MKQKAACGLPFLLNLVLKYAHPSEIFLYDARRSGYDKKQLCQSYIRRDAIAHASLEDEVPDIKDQKLLYHLTALENLPHILQMGLLPRSELNGFADVADPEIIDGRRELQLERYVPFHWFAKNPFDGRVQCDHPDKAFILITVRRALAARENWTVIPRHPLASNAPELLDYQTGIATIDWETMNLRDYHDSECKSICMAECLAPRRLRPADFFKIYAPDDATARTARHLIKLQNLNLEVDVNPGMFL